MRKLAAISVLALAAWILVTFAWAGAAHLTGLPGPARASAASMELAASAITLVEPPGALGIPQRTAARFLRRAGRAGERLHRAPERAVARALDRLGHRHGPGWAMSGFDVHVPPISFELPVDAIERARAQALAAAERARATAERERAWAERGAWLERARAERLRMELDGAREWRGTHELSAEDRRRVERSLEILRERITRFEAGQSEVSRRLEERLREVLREIERQLERELERAAGEIGRATAESETEPIRIRIR